MDLWWLLPGVALTLSGGLLLLLYRRFGRDSLDDEEIPGRHRLKDDGGGRW